MCRQPFRFFGSPSAWECRLQWAFSLATIRPTAPPTSIPSFACAMNEAQLWHSLQAVVPASPPTGPIRLLPSFRERVWGRTNLSPYFPDQRPAQPVGEAWYTAEDNVTD